jgi:hypothetical protein
LDLNGRVNNDTAKIISNLLLHNKTLTCLFLLQNHSITDDGAKDLANALTHNTTLEKLYLGGRNIGAKGIQCLIDIFQQNTTLTLFGLDIPNISDVDLKSIEKYTDRNIAIAKAAGLYALLVDLCSDSPFLRIKSITDSAVSAPVRFFKIASQLNDDTQRIVSSYAYEHTAPVTNKAFEREGMKLIQQLAPPQDSNQPKAS